MSQQTLKYDHFAHEAIGRAIARVIRGEVARTEDTSERLFFRVSGFAEPDYIALIQEISAQGLSRPVALRTIAEISGFESQALGEGKTATHYRNTLSAGEILILLINQQPSDWQGLQDIYNIQESDLVEGDDILIQSVFQGSNLGMADLEAIHSFIGACKSVFLPQLMPLTRFLCAIRKHADLQKEHAIEDVIAYCLPWLGLFRFGHLFGNPQAVPKKIKELRAASDLQNSQGQVVAVDKLLDLIENADISGEKKDQLQRYIKDRSDDAALFIDWSEIELIFTGRTRTRSIGKNPSQFSDAIRAELQKNAVDLTPDDADLLGTLKQGKTLDTDQIDHFIERHGEHLGRELERALRKRQSRTVEQASDDFPLGLLRVIALLAETLPSHGSYRFRVDLANPADLPDISSHALKDFRTLYGALPDHEAWSDLDFHLSPLWEAAATVDLDEATLGDDTCKNEISFRVTLIGSEDNRAATLTWTYSASSPHAVTGSLLRSLRSWYVTPGRGLPVWSAPGQMLTSPLDLMDLSGLGGSIDSPHDVLKRLKEFIAPAQISSESGQKVIEALRVCGDRTADFVMAGEQESLLGPSAHAFLESYRQLLRTVLSRNTLQTNADRKFALGPINEAFTIQGPKAALIPLIHPMKLLWFRGRVAHLGRIIGTIAQHGAGAAFVNARRFSNECAEWFSSSNFPGILARFDGFLSEYFLPANAVQGFELYRHPDVMQTGYSSRSQGSSTKDASWQIARSIQEYLDTFPFTTDGVELSVLRAPNAAFIKGLVQNLIDNGNERSRGARYNLYLHTTQTPARMYEEMSEFLSDERYGPRRRGELIPQCVAHVVTASQGQSETDAITQAAIDHDVAVLFDAFSDAKETIEDQFRPYASSSFGEDGGEYLPLFTYRRLPFAQGDDRRRVAVNAGTHPDVVRLFYLMQRLAVNPALDTGVDPLEGEVRFERSINFAAQGHTLAKLHDHFNWVVCFDRSLDRFLLEQVCTNASVIKHRSRIGHKGIHTLTVSAEQKFRRAVVARLAQIARFYLPELPLSERTKLAEWLADQAKTVSGDLLLRALGKGSFANELIGVVLSKRLVEKELRETDSFHTWVYLDEYLDWFSTQKQRPDLMFVRGSIRDDDLVLDIRLIESKFVAESGYSAEASSAAGQVARGLEALVPAWKRPSEGEVAEVDKDFWYNELYHSVVESSTQTQLIGTSAGAMRAFEEFQRLEKVRPEILFSGEAYVFVHSGHAGDAGGAGAETHATESADGVAITVKSFGADAVREQFLEILGELGIVQSESEPIADEAALEKAGELPGGVPSVAFQTVPVVPLPTGAMKETEEELPPRAVDIASGEAEFSPPGLPSAAVEGAGADIAPSKLIPPGLAVLQEYSSAEEDAEIAGWAEQKLKTAANTLGQFGAAVIPDGYRIGPRVVRLRVLPSQAQGTKVSSIQSRDADLKVALALNESPIIFAGPGYVGIDIGRSDTTDRGSS
jgi:hypothetical protein